MSDDVEEFLAGVPEADELDDDNVLTGVLGTSVPEDINDLPTPDAELWGRGFLQEYKEEGDKHSFENPRLNIGFCLALLSQAVGNAHFYTGDGKVSTKVHPLIIQGSGTGKDPAFTFAKLVADGAGLSMRDTSDVTNAGLIGTVQDGEPKPGLAETADIIGFREATSLFRTTKQKHSSNLAENLNQVLDGKKITRKLAGGSVKYTPDCTLVGTTYPPTDLALEEFMENGLLARFLYFFKPTDGEFRWRMGDRLIAESIKQTDEEEAVQRLQRLSETLEAIDQTFESEQRFWIASSVRELDVSSRLRDVYDEYDGSTMKVVRPAVTRYHVHFLRLSCLMAALDECSVVVEQRHGELALEIIEESWKNLLEFYSHSGSSEETETSLRESETAILRAVINNEGISQKDLADATDYSKRTVRDQTTVLEGHGLLRSKKEGREKRYYLNRDGE